MKRIMAKYNYAFGYVKGYFVLTGLAGVGCVLYMLWAMLTQDVPIGMALGLLAAGAILIVASVLIISNTRSKCPPDRRGIVGLVLSMMLVGVVGCCLVSFKLFGFIFKLIFGVSFSKEGTAVQKFADCYYRDSDGENCYLHSTLDGNFATLHDSSGNSISVRRHSGEILCDDAGNIYRPC